MNTLDQITQIVNSMNPKSYARALKSKPELVSELDSAFPGVENISEKLWLYINNESPKVCSEGNAVPFDSFVKGYRKFCSLGCNCRRSHQSATIASQWKDDHTRQQAMREALVASSRQKYGVDNHMQSNEHKERMVASNLGFDRIWDCGKTKYQWEL